MPGVAVTLRSMRPSDLDDVLRLEKELFSDPWPREMFLHDFGEEDASCLVGEEGEALICYGIAWLVKREYHIANMAVRRARQGEGIGALLLDGMLDEARKRGCDTATLEVRFSNDRAIGLYRSRGFREVAIRPGYYTDNGEDALVMLRELDPPAGGTGGLVQ